MTNANGPTPDMLQQRGLNKKSPKQVVSREDLMRAIQKMQLPGHQPPSDTYSQQVYPPPGAPRVGGANG